MPVAAPVPEKLTTPEKELPPSRQGDVPFWRCGVLLCLAVLMLIVGWLNPSSGSAAISGVVMTLPDIVKIPVAGQHDAQFYGSTAHVTEGELGILPPDTTIVRKQYDDIRDHESVQFTVLLSGAEQNSIHRAEVCLPGQGWTVTGQDNIPIPLISGHTLIVRKLTIQRDTLTPNNEHQLLRAFFMYWFVGDDLTTPSQFMRVFLNTWDRILYNRAYRWAYVMAMSPISSSMRPDGLTAEQTQAMMSGFVRQTVPSFQKSEMPEPAAH